VRKRVGTSKKMAELALKEIELKMIKGEFLGITEPKAVVFDKLCEEYLNFSRANKAKSSYIRDRLSLKILQRHFSGRLITEIKPWDLEQYKNMRINEVSPCSVNRELACIKHMFNKAVEWNYLRDNPIRCIKLLKEPPGRLRYLTEEEEARLLESSSEDTRKIVMFALNTGMRRSEIFNLKWSDIDFANRRILVTKSKNNEQRIIPMNETVFEILNELRKKANSIFVFPGKNGQLKTVKTGFTKAVKRAGIKDFRFHDLRHTFASRLVMAGVDIRTVQQLMGHKDIRMTMRYSHLSDMHLKEAVRKLDGTNLAQTKIKIFGKVDNG